MSEYNSYMWSVSDWRGDDVYDILDNREKGIYRELIDQCWVAGSISADPEDLARFSREPIEYFLSVWAKIRGKFRSAHGGSRLVSKRLEEDRRRLHNIRAVSKQKAKKAAEIRWERERARRKESIELHARSMSQALLDDAQTQTQTQKEEDSSLLNFSKNETSTSPKNRVGDARKTRAPAELEITTEMRTWAESNGIVADLAGETEHMLDYFRGKGEARLDWLATWRTWMRNTKKWGGSNGAYRRNGNGNPREAAEAVGIGPGRYIPRQ